MGMVSDITPTPIQREYTKEKVMAFSILEALNSS